MQRILQSVPPEYRNLPETRLMLTKMVSIGLRIESVHFLFPFFFPPS